MSVSIFSNIEIFTLLFCYSFLGCSVFRATFAVVAEDRLTDERESLHFCLFFVCIFEDQWGALVCLCWRLSPPFVCLLSAVVFFFLFLRNKGEVIDWACGGGEEEMRW